MTQKTVQRIIHCRGQLRSATLQKIGLAFLVVNHPAYAQSIGGFDLHRTVFWLSITIGVITIVALIYSLVRHYRQEVQQAGFFKQNAVAFLWALIPIAMLIIMVLPACFHLFS